MDLVDVAVPGTLAPTAEDAALVRPFRLALLGVAIAFVLIGGLLAAYGSGSDRPEGVTERWLTDVGDTRRDGVGDEALRRVEDVGTLTIAERLLPSASTDGRTAFVDLEVGKAEGDAATTRVPFRLHQRVDGSAGPAVYGTLRLEKVGDGWKVRALERATDGLRVPSEGGPPAAEAPLGLFAGALAVAAVVTAGCVALVRRAGGDGDGGSVAAAPAQPRARTSPQGTANQPSS